MNLIGKGFSLLFICVSLISCQQDAKQQGQQQQQQQGQQSQQMKPKPKAKATLYSSEDCHDDIVKYCPRARLTELSDLSVLQCLYNEIKDLTVLESGCQHLIYSYKRNLTRTLKLDSTAENICKDEIQRFEDCKNVEDINGHLVSCLLEKVEDIKNVQCKTFLTNIASLMFTDYRLVYKFQEKCGSDIDKLNCGRLDNDNEAPHDQGKTIACLSLKFTSLNPECRKEVFRLAELQSDDFHLDRTLYFACKDDREKFCDKVVSGKGRVYKCLMKSKFQPEMSKECQEQLTKRQQLIAEDVNVDKSFITACKKDILKYECRNELRNNNTEGLKLSAVLLCLEAEIKKGADIDPDCRSEMIEHRKMLFSDYKLNPDLVKACTNEINTFCNGGIERDGKTLHCLFRNAKDLKTKADFKSECVAELRKLVKIADVGEDIRVDPHLFQTCQNVITGPCKNIQPGQGRLIECLLKNIGTNDMSDDCEERLLEIQFFVARDWKLNPNLYKICKDDAIKHCNAKRVWHDWSTDVEEGPLVLPCLYHHIHEQDDQSGKPKVILLNPAIYAVCKKDAVKFCFAKGEDWIDENQDYDVYNDPRVILSCLYRKALNNQISQACAIEVKRVVQTRAKSIDLMPEIQEACTKDLSDKCSNVETTKKGEELRCLQDNFKDLEDECKKKIEEFTKDESEDIRLDQILMKSCLPIINEFCADEKNEEKGDLLECLIKQKNNPKIDPKCRIGIEHHQLVNLQNINFNVKFLRFCEKNIKEYCKDINDKNEIIQCLSAYVLNDTLLESKQRIDLTCRAQLKFELLQMNEDLRLDPALLKSCQDDVNNFCSNIQFGKAQVLECLKANVNKLSKECSSKLLKRERFELVDQSVDFKLKEKCKTAITEFCSIDGGEVDLISCLRKHLLKPNIDTACRQIVINRIMLQNKDIRSNPSLWKACRRDTEKFCKKEFINVNEGEELNGRVIQCLKAEFVKNTLSNTCGLEIEQIMREAANVDYRLDPLLTEACFNEIHQLCEDSADDKKEDCLRVKFQQGKINRDSKCYKEVKRIILEGAADIFADHELQESCFNDLQRLCYDVPPGAAQQLKCLLTANDSKKVRLAPKCIESLQARRELWKLAQVSERMLGIQELVNTINESENRLYIFGILLTIVLLYLYLVVH